MAWHARLRPLRVTVAGPSSFLRNGKLILALRRNPGLDGLNHGPGTCAPGPSRERACTVDSVHNRMSRARWGPCDSGSVTCHWGRIASGVQYFGVPTTVWSTLKAGRVRGLRLPVY